MSPASARGPAQVAARAGSPAEPAGRARDAGSTPARSSGRRSRPARGASLPESPAPSNVRGAWPDTGRRYPTRTPSRQGAGKPAPTRRRRAASADGACAAGCAHSLENQVIGPAHTHRAGSRPRRAADPARRRPSGRSNDALGRSHRAPARCGRYGWSGEGRHRAPRWDLPGRARGRSWALPYRTRVTGQARHADRPHIRRLAGARTSAHQLHRQPGRGGATGRAHVRFLNPTAPLLSHECGGSGGVERGSNRGQVGRRGSVGGVRPPTAACGTGRSRCPTPSARRRRGRRNGGLPAGSSRSPSPRRGGASTRRSPSPRRTSRA